MLYTNGVREPLFYTVFDYELNEICARGGKK